MGGLATSAFGGGAAHAVPHAIASPARPTRIIPFTAAPPRTRMLHRIRKHADPPLRTALRCVTGCGRDCGTGVSPVLLVRTGETPVPQSKPQTRLCRDTDGNGQVELEAFDFLE